MITDKENHEIKFTLPTFNDIDFKDLAKCLADVGGIRKISLGLPSKYIINENAAILFWEDGEKTIVKKSADDVFDKRIAFLTAYFQRHSGLSKTKANKFLKELIIEEKNNGAN